MTMRPMTSFVDHTLMWTNPNIFESKYELRFGDELVATFRSNNIFSSSAIAESGDGCWTFEKTGFLNGRTIIRPFDSSTVVGTYRENMWKESGSLELSDGRIFLVHASRWKRTIEFQTEIKEKLIQMKSSGVFRLSAKVQMYRKCLHVPEFPWMVMLGLYLLRAMKKEAAKHAVPV